MKNLRMLLVAVSFMAAGSVSAQPPVEEPTLILVNGKIVTVDDYFSIQEAVAIAGEEIEAVGSDADIRRLAGRDTVIVDLEGRTVIPGLIDNHIHAVRGTEYWFNEQRLDGVTTRAEAVRLLKAKAASLPAGEWLMTLGGWLETQFVDSNEVFTRAELDEIAPNRPAYIQAGYNYAVGNTAWFEAMGIPVTANTDAPASTHPLAPFVERDERGVATGMLTGGMRTIGLTIPYYPDVPSERQAESIKSMFTWLNSIGLTTVYDPGGGGIQPESYDRIWDLARKERLTVRLYRTIGSDAETPEQADELITAFTRVLPFQGDAWLDTVSLGESIYRPFQSDTPIRPATPGPEDIEVARKIYTAAAQSGWPVQTHATQPETIDYLLDLTSEVNAVYPIRHLRWSITHGDNITLDQLKRMRHLGMNLQLRSNPVVGNRRIVANVFGERVYQMPPLRMVHESGVRYGIGTDGMKAGPILPFLTLWWAVTGKALNGEVIQHQTLTREEALIAATRSNAYLVWQEANIGSIQPGLYADLLVLDRDYLTVPEDEIKEITPVATLVGGRVVYGEL